MNTGKITYADAIEKIMEAHGGSASLKTLYDEIWQYIDRSKFHGKTPLATIRQRLQTTERQGNKRFKRISIGHWALADYTLPRTAEKEEERNHTEIQGMLLIIGSNLWDMKTYSANKKKEFEGQKLEDIATYKQCPPFTYDRFIKEISRIDIIWFNKQGFPKRAFEVEHTTKFKGAFGRFLRLEHFQTKLFCVAEKQKKSKFEEIKEDPTYSAIKTRVGFWSYDEVEATYRAALIKEQNAPKI